MKLKLMAPAVLAAAMLYSAPSQAAEIVESCAAIGLDDLVPGAIACVGYYDKNVLKTDAGDWAKDDELAALALLGLSGPRKVIEKIDNSGDFLTPLTGMTWVGVHYGAGNGPVSTPGGVTAFYKFEAGINLDFFTFSNGSVSGVALYATGGPPDDAGGVPEPSTWAMLIGGLGLTGAALRRRKTSVQFA